MLSFAAKYNVNIGIKKNILLLKRISKKIYICYLNQDQMKIMERKVSLKNFLCV